MNFLGKSINNYVIKVGPDSFLIKNFVKNFLEIDNQTLFAILEGEVPWTDPSDPDFKYRGNELARKKAFFVKLLRELTRIPKYG